MKSLDRGGPDLARRLLARDPTGRVPLNGQWELTCRCNLRCVMCYTDPYNTPDWVRQELSYPEIRRILGEITDAGCLTLCLTGGEPLARPDFADIYLDAKRLGLLVTVFTNGTLITPALADLWAVHPPSMVEISMHGYGREAFERITAGPGSYDRCLTGIRLVLERRLPLTLKTTGMTLNRDEILSIKEWAASLGPVQYRMGSTVRPRLDESDDVFDYQLDDDEIARIERSDPQFRAERIKQDEETERARARGSRCGSVSSKFHIDAYGRLQLCSDNRRASYDLRRGSFREGFYEALPSFPCPRRQGAEIRPAVLLDRQTLRPGVERTVPTS